MEWRIWLILGEFLVDVRFNGGNVGNYIFYMYI